MWDESREETEMGVNNQDNKTVCVCVVRRLMTGMKKAKQNTSLSN